jgi:hypothetical protein
MSILAIIGLAVVIFVVFAALRPVDPGVKNQRPTSISIRTISKRGVRGIS